MTPQCITARNVRLVTDLKIMSPNQEARLRVMDNHRHVFPRIVNHGMNH